MAKGIAILGSTGSIGTSALDLIERLNGMGSGPRFEVLALAGNRKIEVLVDQVRRFRPRLACAGSEELAGQVRAAIGDLPTRIVSGPAGLRDVATMPGADLVLAAIVGAAGLEPTFAAVEIGRTVALANKEALVMAGDLMISAARRSGARLLPVDSEHNALHQCLRGERVEEVRRLVLTASGGPFFLRPDADLLEVTPEEALAHPTWVMGRKISIDSATLMNKALEVIEARWLYDIPGERITVIVHPQSTIHSLVEFVDGSFICQLGATDMRHPIQYALTWPERCATPLEPVDLAALKSMSFFTPDTRRFPCLPLGWRALEAGGTMPAVLNAANEIAVEAFLERRIRFGDIPRIITSVMDAHRPAPASSLEVILKADAWARGAADEVVAPRAAAAPSRTTGLS
ncbi:MAG TPA: 1-deoxy-D-xylulose-5-phosphate reductoisomerase [Candidatus Polarisedimenticolia bacterium]|jgi:1-deoxy-D-xylulose-5-phosphate reductoisomerase